MTMYASIHGRLGATPKQIQTKSGKPMATGSVAVSVGSNGEETETLWLGVLAFGKIAESFLKHQKGDLISLSGRAQQNRWTNSEGVENVRLEIIADSVISARTVRPSGKRKAQDDDIDF